MRIEIIVKETEEEQEVYGFILFDLMAVFVTYHVHEKPKGKKKWKIIGFWDNYNRRDSTLEEPVLPECIKREAALKLAELIKVNTWNEYVAKR